ncbi:MAG: hypothetical protein EP334_07650 [Gammaproteobacteria bacterium]|nr:MAG: hypothetical protein EP334_07650 [Gammaproteobacteria bacterium]
MLRSTATGAINLLKKAKPRWAGSKFLLPIILSFLILVFFLNGCATVATLSQFENSLITNEPQKASLVMYRSNEESLMHRVFIDIHVDGKPFMKLMRGEYIQIYLSVASHTIKVEYDRYPDADHVENQEIIDLKPGQVLYMEIVPSFEGWTWVCGVTYYPICAPMPAPKVDLALRAEKDARKAMGKAVDRELLKERIILQH